MKRYRQRLCWLTLAFCSSHEAIAALLSLNSIDVGNTEHQNKLFSFSTLPSAAITASSAATESSFPLTILDLRDNNEAAFHHLPTNLFGSTISVYLINSNDVLERGCQMRLYSSGFGSFIVTGNTLDFEYQEPLEESKSTESISLQKTSLEQKIILLQRKMWGRRKRRTKADNRNNSVLNSKFIQLAKEETKLQDLLFSYHIGKSTSSSRSMARGRSFQRKLQTAPKQGASSFENMIEGWYEYKPTTNDKDQCVTTDFIQCILAQAIPSRINGKDLSDRVLRILRRLHPGRPNPTRESDSQPQRNYIRLLVISDTHAMEDQLELPLPTADILVHCGDYFDDAAYENHLDEWLANHVWHIPHCHVVRGNHDPRNDAFPKSGAVYHAKKTSALVDIGMGVMADIRPFSRSRQKLEDYPTVGPPSADLIISHEPPYGTLDRTCHKDRIGNMGLRLLAGEKVDDESVLLPKLWLCGHIHEDRGAMWHRFGSGALEAMTTAGDSVDQTDTVLVVNAANANFGKATHIAQTRPVLIDLVPELLIRD